MIEMYIFVLDGILQGNFICDVSISCNYKCL